MIRKAKQADLDNLYHLIRYCISDMQSKGFEQWPDWYPNKRVLSDDIFTSSLYLAEKNQEVIGMVVLNPDIPEAYNNVSWKICAKKVNSIHRLAVHPELKTPGLANELVTYVEHIARKNGDEVIRLDTYSKNSAAVKFYQKMGYQYTGNIHLKFMPEHYRCFEKAL